MTGFNQYTQFDGLGLAKLVRDKEVTPSELVEAALGAIERVDPKLNAIVTALPERAREWAKTTPRRDQPFGGVPFLLKDLSGHLAGVRNTSGSRYEKDFIPRIDAELTTRFKRSGVVIVGKSTTSELGLMPATESALQGPTENPWVRGRSVGGSSGGAAAAVAARIVPLAHASDGGGSIRTPASCNGLFGLKPSRARNPVGPSSTESWHGFTAQGVVSRSVRDSAAMLDATHGPEGGAPYYVLPPERPFAEEVGADPGQLRIAVSKRPHLPGEVHADVRRAVDDTAKLCEALGHRVEEADLDIDPLEFGMAYYTIVASEVAAYYERSAEHIGRPPRRGELEPPTVLTVMMGKRFSGAQVCAALTWIRRLGQRVAEFLKTYDVLLTPTLATPPPKHYALRPSGLEATAHRLVAAGGLSPVLELPGVVESAVKRVYRFIPFSTLANATGLPAASVPLHWNDDGLPIGSMFTARFGDEATLFRLAAQLEAERPWADRKPPVCA